MSDRDDGLAVLGVRLRKWRESQPGKLSHRAAGELIRASQTTWTAWERGEKAPDLHFAFELEKLTEGPDQILASEWAFPRKGSKAADQTGPQQVVTDAAAVDLTRTG